MDPDEQDNTQHLPPVALGRNLWALKAEARGTMRALMRGGFNPQWSALTMGAKAAEVRRVSSTQRTTGAVAVIPLCGVLTPRGSWLSMLFGGGAGGLQGFREAFGRAVNDPDIGAIVLDVDSPGGMVDLCPETAADVYNARGTKPIIAIANTCAASGAYWIAAQADELVVTPSGDVGSIGVYMLHEDYSGWNDRVGIDPTFITATDSPYKVDGNMEEPLSESARADWQAQVDDIMGTFAGSVAQARGITVEQVIETYGGGRCLLADRALEAGMVDRIATFEDVVAELLAPTVPGGATASADTVTLRSYLDEQLAEVRASVSAIAAGARADSGDDEEEEDDDAPDGDDDDEQDDDDDELEGEPIVGETDAAAAAAERRYMRDLDVDRLTA